MKLFKKSIVFFFLLFASECFAQPNTFLKVYYSNPNQTATSVVPSGNGYIITIPWDQVSSDILLKTDSIGNVVLSKQHCGVGAVSIRETTDSNFVYSTGTFVGCLNSGMAEDFQFYKINSNLDTLSRQSYPTPLGNYARCIRPLKDGSFIMAGRSDGGDNFYRLDSIGNVIWQHWIPMDEIYSVIEDSEGNFVLCGTIFGFLNSWSVIKTDSTGNNILWSKYYGINGGNLVEAFYDLVQLPDSNYLLGGWNPFMFMKLNKNSGDSLWTNPYPGRIFSIDTTIDGKYITAGNGYMSLLNDTGGIIWIITSSYLYFNWIRSTSDGGFVATGFFYIGSQQWPMLLKTDSLGNFTTGINELNIQVLNYNLYPNPVTTQSKLEFGNAKREQYEFALYDITGRQIETAFTNGDGITIKKENKPAGLYLFALRNEKTGEVMNGKVIIE